MKFNISFEKSAHQPNPRSNFFANSSIFGFHVLETVQIRLEVRLCNIGLSKSVMNFILD